MASPLNANQLIDRYNQITDLLNSGDHLSCRLNYGKLHIDRIDKPRGWTWILAKIFRYKAVSRRHESVATRIYDYISTQQAFHDSLDLHEQLTVLNAFSKLVCALRAFELRKKNIHSYTDLIFSGVRRRIAQINASIADERRETNVHISSQERIIASQSSHIATQTTRILTLERHTLTQKEEIEKQAAALNKLERERHFIIHHREKLLKEEAQLRDREVELTVWLKEARGKAQDSVIPMPPPVVSSTLSLSGLSLREEAEKGETADLIIECISEVETKRAEEFEIKALDESNSSATKLILHGHTSVLKNYEYFKGCLHFSTLNNSLEGEKHKSVSKTHEYFKRFLRFATLQNTSEGKKYKIELPYSKQAVSAALDWFYLKTFRIQPTPLQLLELIDFAHYIQENELMIFVRKQLQQILRKDFNLLLETICVYFCKSNRHESLELLLLTELSIWFSAIEFGKFDKTIYFRRLNEKLKVLLVILHSQEHFAYNITSAAIKNFKIDSPMRLDEEPTLAVYIEQGCLAGWAPAIAMRIFQQLNKREQAISVIQAEEMLKNISSVDFPPSLYMRALLYRQEYAAQNLTYNMGRMKANQLYRECAEMGYTPAMNKMGHYLLTKTGSDPTEGIKWFKAAANQGCGRSAWKLYKMRDLLEEGEGAHWLQLSASLGYHRALVQILNV